MLNISEKVGIKVNVYVQYSTCLHKFGFCCQFMHAFLMSDKEKNLMAEPVPKPHQSSDCSEY